MRTAVKRYNAGLDSSMILRALRVPLSEVSYDLYFHLNRVFPTVVHKRNSLILLLDAIDGHVRLAVPGADL
jgi:hypothetical protein